jgi:hypothetical protein
MSYYAPINFKIVKEGELYAFLKKIKDTCKKKFDEIAKNEFIYMPSINKDYLLKNDSEYAKEQLDRAWMRNSIFSYRFFYIPEHNLLGVFSLPDAVEDIFDLTCHFQNSCDQDYDFEDWKGVPIFEQIAEKWKNATDEATLAHYNERWREHENKIDYDYYRRTFAYEEIWEMCETYLYHEEDVVYISMFGGYEIAEQKGFVHMCRKAYDEWKKQFEKPKESEDTE